MNESPLQIYNLTFDESDFIATITTAQTLDSVFLHLCKFKFNLELHHTDVFDPQYTLDKHKLEKGFGENNWSYISNDCRYIMEHAFGCRMHNITFSYKQSTEMDCADLSKEDF